MDPDMVRELDRLERRVLAVEYMPIRLGVIESELAAIKEDVSDLRRKIEDRSRERERERREHAAARLDEAKSRKNDRWLFIGTAVGAVGACGWIVSLLTGPT